ncbi:MAG TPA: response regulator [Terriglobia bacterium]|nr:response regulator [Terriglobia bacterium]
MAKKATILIVDKEKILVDLLIRALSSADLSVVGATSADEGARLIDLHAPDLIVIDPSLQNGLPLLASLGSSEAKSKIIVVAASDEIRARATDIGVPTIVDRDAGFDALVAAIRGQLPSDLKILGSDNSIHVLVCDDEEELRTLLSEFLKTRGYAVGMAANGREAVEYIRNHPETKIALLDVSMPVMGGMEALSQIMQSDPHPHVLMMTAVADREIARQAMKTGAFDYILKPFDFGAIESSITACLSHFEYQKQPWWKKFTRG